MPYHGSLTWDLTVDGVRILRDNAVDAAAACEEAATVELEATEMAVPVTDQAMQLHAATATPPSGRWSGTGLTPG
jgi:alkylation response protein AidB-like acyl-CoA dehydrogenase